MAGKLCSNSGAAIASQSGDKAGFDGTCAINIITVLDMTARNRIGRP
jgi:hypothetical protein